jgi:hypothetical protein
MRRPLDAYYTPDALAERPSFTGGGTDSAAYGWFWFDREWKQPAEVIPGWSWRQP